MNNNIPNPKPDQINNGEEEEDYQEDDAYFEEEEDLESLLLEPGRGEEAAAKLTQALLKLPLDIFLNIISWLPIKPSAVTSCVCKTWYTILFHSSFSKLQFAKAIQQPHHVFNGATSILLHNGICGMHLLQYEKDCSFENVVTLNPGFDDPDMEYDLVGSCNGLLCLAEREKTDPVYVCNPVIGELMTLPGVEKEARYGVIPGFGFDEVAKEYKVIRLVYDWLNLEPFVGWSFILNAEIHTLGSGEWRDLGNVPYPIRKTGRQVFVNGAFHWYNKNESIVAFDVGREEFKVVEAPPDLASTHGSIELGEIGGNLCLCHDTSDDWCEIWLMKVYGVKKSWTKQYVISRSVAGLTKLHFWCAILMENGNILFGGNECLVCYDTTGKNLSKLENGKFPHAFYVTTHVASFISLRDAIGTTSR